MSCCLIFQNKDNIFIGADSAVSVFVDSAGEFFRSSNDGEKLFEIGKDIVFCSGDMSEVPNVIKNMRVKDGYVDLEHISKYLKTREFKKCPIFDVPSIVVLICRVISGNSYVYSLEPNNNFNIVTHIGTNEGVQVWSSGIHSNKCLEIAEEEMKRSHCEAIHAYINIYIRMACQEIGGNINVYYLNSDGNRKIINNYDLKDGYKARSFQYDVYGVYAEAIVGNLIAGDKMFIGNKNGNVIISKDGIDVANGSLCIANDEYSIELDPNHRLKQLNNYMGGMLDHIRDDFLFCIRNKNVPIDKENNDIIMGIDTRGNGYFKGNITGSKITGSCLVTNNKNKTNVTEISGGFFKNFGYIGEDLRTFTITNGNVFISKNNNSSCRLDSDIFSLILKNEIPEINEDRTEYVVDLSDSFTTNLTTYFLNNVFMNRELDVSKSITVGNGLGTINGILNSISDRNLKSNIKPLTEKHILFFYLLQPVSFTFKNSKSGRTHVGFISQDVENAMKQAGLADLDFAGFCKDVKMIETENEYGNTTRQIEKDEHGNDVYIYSLRYDEFIALNTFMIQNLYKENQYIKDRLLRLEEKIDNLKRTLK